MRALGRSNTGPASPVTVGSQAKAGIGRYIEFYNARRPHSTLDKKTPDEFHFASLPALLKAA